MVGPVAYRVLVDACALAPKTLRDWLLQLRLHGNADLFSLHYTEDTLAETIHTVRRMYPDLPGVDVTKIRDKIVNIMDDRIDDYGHGQEEPTIKDPFDRHVHAAATDGQVDILVTADTGFLQLDEVISDRFQYEIYHPDDLFLLVDDADPTLVQVVLQAQIAHRTKVGTPDYDFAGALRKSNCPQFADRITRRLQQLALIR